MSPRPRCCASFRVSFEVFDRKGIDKQYALNLVSYDRLLIIFEPHIEEFKLSHYYLLLWLPRKTRLGLGDHWDDLKGPA